jgi:hypothetical protein
MSLHPLYSDKCSFELWLDIDNWLLWIGLDRGHVSCMGQEKNICRILVGKREGKRPLGRHGQRLENSVKMDITVVKWNKWIRFTWIRIDTSGTLLYTWL